MSDRFSADASALGYFYQTRYALLLLLRADVDDELSIERFDDVAFTNTGDPIELIQTKHHIKSNKSLSDASSDLWKTLRVWSEKIAKGEIQLGKVRLTLITTSKALDDSAASKLCPPNISTATRRDVSGALQLLTRVVEKSQNQQNKAAYDAFTKLGKEKQLAMLESVTVLDGSPSIGDTKAGIIDMLKLTARREHRQPLFDRLQAWWFERVIQHLSGRREDRITYKELDTTVQDLRDQFHQENLPIDYKNLAAPAETELKMNERIFITQLRLVDVAEPRIKTAIGDYYKAYQQRSRWIREELLNIGELESYESTLIDEWKRQYDRLCERIKSSNETEKRGGGNDLYNWMEEKADYKIRPRITERYVARGSYHILSNRLKVGWHPDYKTHMYKSVKGLSTEEMI